MAQKRLSFFVIAVLSALILPGIFRDGMFMDGMLYSSVAMNYARGNGTFWHPHFAKIPMSFFHEQPPLMFAILGTFFKIFGRHYLVERIYSLLMFLLSVFIFSKIWKELSKKDERLKQFTAWPLLLWVSAPILAWSVVNNMEENTMGVFCLLAAFFLLKSIFAEKKFLLILVMLSSICIVAAFLTKGFPGLFTVCLPTLYFLFFRERLSFKKMLVLNLMLLFFLSVAGIFLFTFPPSALCLNSWLNERVINSIKNVSNSTSHFEMLWLLIQQLVPVFIMGGALFLFVKIKKIKPAAGSFSIRKTGLIFLALAVCGSFPLMVTREQRTFYLCTSLPFYAIGFALLFFEYFHAFMKFPWHPVYLLITTSISGLAVAAAITLCVLLFNIPKRDADKIYDVKIICSKISEGQVIRIPHSLWNDWELQTLLNRNGYISLGKEDADSLLFGKYLLHDGIKEPVNDTANYTRLNWGLERYIIYEKKNCNAEKISQSLQSLSVQ